MNTEACSRGCSLRDRHLTDCEDRDTCRGCLPRRAEHGHLCYPDHARLVELLKAAPMQHDLLQAVAGMRAAPAPRGDADLIHGKHHEAPPPLRLACIDQAREIADWLSVLVERIVEDHRMRGPKRYQSNDQRSDGRRRVTLARGERTGFRWIDPPARFEVHTAANWMRSQLDRVESLDSIGDDFDTFAEIMSQAHALAPWREEMTRMDGIACPTCKACALVLFGGDENVTCLRCNESVDPGRYAIWVRMLSESATA